MASIDPRTPVIVGAGQINHRDRRAEPIDLMTRSTEAALEQCGAATLRSRIDAVRVVWGVWPYRDPGRLVATQLGAHNARSTLTPVGGNQVYDLVADTALRIQAGQLDVAVVCAAEAMRTRRHDRSAGVSTFYVDEAEGATPDEQFGDQRPLATDAERRYGIDVPTTFYAMAETALRHRLGESIDGHRRRIADMWSDASAVAGANPDAWITDLVDATTIATESPRNRPVASPYPKLMTSNLDVDQGGAVVMCTAEAAEAAGVPRDLWVFPWSGAGAADHWHPTNRWAFDESPAIRLAGQRALQVAGLTLDDCELLDLYSCFPVAVQVAQRELGVDPSRAWTITGGLTFAAGPLNCYCILALKRAVDLIHDDPSRRALLTGNGGYFTKHSMLTLAGSPSEAGPFRSESVQGAVDALPSRATPQSRPSSATLEAYTVTYNRDAQPERAVMACLDDAGSRHWAESTDQSTLADLLANDRCGTTMRLA